MSKKITINNMINHVTFSVDSITKNKNYPKQLINQLYLIASGMILNYGEDYINDIYDTISRTDFIITNKGNLYDINKYSFYNLERNNYLNKTIEIKDNLGNIDLKYNIYVDIDNLAPIKSLEYLTYELNYILFNKTTKLSLRENFKVRLDFLTKKFVANTLNDNNEAMTIDYLYNSLQTEDIIKNILGLHKEHIKNNDFLIALEPYNTIDKKRYCIGGLSILINLVRPVYKDIKALVNSFNRKKDIEREFDKILGKNTYKELCKKIELLNNYLSNSLDNNYYFLASEYLAIRNNYINRYLKTKYA